MKLIELLARELEKNGGWKEFATHCVQDSSHYVWFFRNGNPKYFAGMWAADIDSNNFDWEGSVFLSGKSDDNSDAIISREQYESALAALTETAPQPVESLAWDGNGRPPEGIECEVKSGKNSYALCKIVHSSDAGVAFVYLEDERYKGILDCLSRDGVENNFRPIRTDAERRREEAVKAIMHVVNEGNGISLNLYEAIAAGKIPGVKLCE